MGGIDQPADTAEPVIAVRAQLRSSRARIRATRWLHPGYTFYPFYG
jgi:hypothetical protein